MSGDCEEVINVFCMWGGECVRDVVRPVCMLRFDNGEIWGADACLCNLLMGVLVLWFVGGGVCIGVCAYDVKVCLPVLWFAW